MMKSVTSNLKLKNPIGDFPFYILVETSGSNAEHDAQVSERSKVVILSGFTIFFNHLSKNTILSTDLFWNTPFQTSCLAA